MLSLISALGGEEVVRPGETALLYLAELEAGRYGLPVVTVDSLLKAPEVPPAAAAAAVVVELLLRCLEAEGV